MKYLKNEDIVDGVCKVCGNRYALEEQKCCGNCSNELSEGELQNKKCYNCGAKLDI